MNERIWTEIDDYVETHLVDDEISSAVQRSIQESDLPSISVSPTQGKFLGLLVQLSRARTVLELGTLGGYSTTWLARALPEGGKVVTLEADPRHADVAKANFVAAGVADRVQLWLGTALDTLPRLDAEGFGPVDLVFIDADKANNASYLGWALKFAHPGTVIVVDNVVRAGAVLDDETDDPSVRGCRDAVDLLASHPRLDATALQTVGCKGHDGFAIAIVR